MSASVTGRARGEAGSANGAVQRQLAWPGDPAGLTADSFDFEALAYVLANTCRWGGRTRRFYSAAQRAALASEAIEALDGLGAEECRSLALRALLADARIAWLGDRQGGGPASARTAERSRREGAAIDRAVLEAAGLTGELSLEQADLLRFVARMTDAAEQRDLAGAGIGEAPRVAFPPLKRRIRPLEPGKAARLWLKRFRALVPPTPADESAETPANATQYEENDDVAHLARTQPEEPERETDARNKGRSRAA